MRTTTIAAALLTTGFFSSCERQPVDYPESELKVSRGVFILNEGQFLSANASISWFDPRSDSLMNHVFYHANQAPLGDVAHSMTVWGDEVFTVVNNSGKIYRTKLADMEYSGKITGLTSPRYICPVDTDMGSKAYISDLYSGRILVVDPDDGNTLDSIDIRGPANRSSTEQMLLIGDKLYAACWSYGQHIMVIDTRTDRIIDSIEVGKQPVSMVTDGTGKLWVLSDGGYEGSPGGQEKASLSCIDPQTNLAVKKKTWDDIRVSPSDLCVNTGGDSLYILAGDVYKVSLEMEGFSKPFVIGQDRQFYSLGVDPVDGTVYIGDAVDYQQDGWVYRYSPRGMTIDSFQVGVNPGHFCFLPQEITSPGQQY